MYEKKGKMIVVGTVSGGGWDSECDVPVPGILGTGNF